MAFRFLIRALAAPLLLLNFLMYAVVVGIAGWALNLAIDDSWEAVSYSPASFYFVIFALIAGVVGIASKFSGAHHLRWWQADSLAASSAAGLIAWFLTLLALGLAIKEIRTGGIMFETMYTAGRSENHRELCCFGALDSIRKICILRVLEAFVIILSATQLFYLVVIGAGVFSGEYRRSREVYQTEPPPVEKEAPPVVAAA